MFRYPYTTATFGSPPAPFVLLNIAAVGSDRWLTDIPALADTGADVTVVTAAVVAALGLEALDEVATIGLGGEVVGRSSHAVRLVVRDLPAVELEVVGSADWGYVILGRDVLNRYRVVFDGPNRRVEISV